MKINVFPDASGEWRWHATSRNGRILSDSAEGYTRRASAERAAISFVKLCSGLDEASVAVLDTAPSRGAVTKKVSTVRLTPVPAKKAAAKKAPAKKRAAKR